MLFLSSTLVPLNPGRTGRTRDFKQLEMETWISARQGSKNSGLDTRSQDLTREARLHRRNLQMYLGDPDVERDEVMTCTMLVT